MKKEISIFDGGSGFISQLPHLLAICAAVVCCVFNRPILLYPCPSPFIQNILEV